jgi:hypothetical protein
MQMKGTIDKPWMAEGSPSAAVVLPGEARAAPGTLLGVF